jgi:hypothetical protein
MEMETPVRVLGLVVVLGWGSSACGPLFPVVEVRCEGWRPGELILTELLPDPEGLDTGKEWVEVHNPGREAVDLRGLTLYTSRLDGTRERAFTFLEPAPVGAGAYVVLGDVRSEPLPAHVDYSYGEGLGALGNMGGRVGLRCGPLVVDEVSYVSPLRSGVSRMYDGRFVPEADDNDELERWCDAPPSDSGGGARGSPGLANPHCAVPLGGIGEGAMPDEGRVDETCLSEETGAVRAVVAPGPGDVLLTEFMADPKVVADAVGEWVEVHARREVDLNGVTLANERNGRTTLSDARCLTVKAGAQVVLARSAEPVTNGGLPPVLGTFSFSLGNSAAARALRLSRKGVLLDEVTWTSAALPGVSQQMDPRRPGLFCPTPEGIRYGGGDRGTPGGENHPCGP